MGDTQAQQHKTVSDRMGIDWVKPWGLGGWKSAQGVIAMATIIARVCEDVLMYGKLKVVLKRWGVPTGKRKLKRNLLHRE